MLSVAEISTGAALSLPAFMPVRAAGGPDADAFCVQPADDAIVMVIMCQSEESSQRVHHEVSSPWIREHLFPYLASTDRKTGPVIARAQDFT